MATDFSPGDLAFIDDVLAKYGNDDAALVASAGYPAVAGLDDPMLASQAPAAFLQKRVFDQIQPIR
jgi:hypothetical protein